jgi:hypothetical protein
VLIISLGHLDGAKRDREDRPAMTLRVIREVGIDDGIVSAARKEAINTMGRAGVLLVWLSCDGAQADVSAHDACHEQSGPLEFSLRITKSRPSGCGTDILGFSELDDSVGMRSATVYYPAILQFADHFRVGPATVLGNVIAHEIGHLILGADAHVALGLMSPRWGKWHFRSMDFNALNFDARQKQLLRLEIVLHQSPAFVGRNSIAPGPLVNPNTWFRE